MKSTRLHPVAVHSSPLRHEQHLQPVFATKTRHLKIVKNETSYSLYARLYRFLRLSPIHQQSFPPVVLPSNFPVSYRIPYLGFSLIREGIKTAVVVGRERCVAPEKREVNMLIARAATRRIVRTVLHFLKNIIHLVVHGSIALPLHFREVQ